MIKRLIEKLKTLRLYFVIKRIISYKNNNFDSWLEFILTFGVCRFNDGGFLLFLYGWGGGIAMLGMWIMFKYILI